MNNNPLLKFLAAAIVGIVLLILLALAFIGLADPTRETVTTSPPEQEVRELRSPEPATSTAPGAPLSNEPPPVFTNEPAPSDTGNDP
jgi:type IV secretory pathway VirB10-like protein